MGKNQLKNYKERNELVKGIRELEKEIEILENKNELKEMEKLILKGLKKRVELLTIRENILMNGIIKESLERKKDTM